MRRDGQNSAFFFLRGAALSFAKDGLDALSANMLSFIRNHFRTIDGTEAHRADAFNRVFAHAHGRSYFTNFSGHGS